MSKNETKRIQEMADRGVVELIVDGVQRDERARELMRSLDGLDEGALTFSRHVPDPEAQAAVQRALAAEVDRVMALTLGEREAYLAGLLS